MKGIEQTILAEFGPEFRFKRNRDGDITLHRKESFGWIELDIIFNDQTYENFKVIGKIRFEELEALVAPFNYYMNPAYLKEMATIAFDSGRSEEFEMMEKTSVQRIITVTRFVLRNIEELDSIDRLKLTLDNQNFKDTVFGKSILPVSKQMRRIAIAKILKDPSLNEIIEKEMNEVEKFSTTGAFNYKGLLDFVNSLR